MSNILTIARREFSVYFQSLIGYLYIIIFLLVSIGLYMTPFFTFPVADMRSFFNLLPIILCIFVPAITMRLWAEEKKENTFEMLMTLPMKTYQIVVGKFLGALTFFFLSLVGTFVIPVMLISLGTPDTGQIFSSYLGTILLGAMLLSLGIFISGFCKDQITAFILTLLVAISMFLLGTSFFQTYIDGIIPGLGSLIGEIFGFPPHFAYFEKGVVDLTHIIYFLSWTLLFLFFNGFFLEIRNRPEMKLSFTTGLVLIMAIGLILNWILSDMSLGRLDLTEGKIHTISRGTKKILSNLKVPVNLKLYITPKNKMPTELKTLERSIADKLQEMKRVSRRKINYSIIYMEAANVLEDVEKEENKKSQKEEAIEKRMLKKGIQPFSAQSIREDSVVNVLIYSALGIAYKELKEEIIPKIVPQNIHELEYLITSAIYKLTREKMPVIALVAPKEAIKIPPHLKELYLQMGRPVPQTDDPYIYLEEILKHEKYDVKRVGITESSPLPDEFDTLVIVNPRDLNERQKFEINKAVVEGRNGFLSIQKYIWDYRITDERIHINRREETPQIDDLLTLYGVTVSNEILMDENHQPLTISDPRNPLASLLGGGITLNLPIQIALSQESMNPDVSITSRLSNLSYLWGGALDIHDDIIKKNGLNLTTLMTTSERAWTVPSTANLDSSSFNSPQEGMHKIPVSVMLSGQFPNLFKDKVMPDWPDMQDFGTDKGKEEQREEKPFTDYKEASAKLILVGGAQMFQKDLLRRSNLDFFLNSIDALSLGEDLIDVRAKKIINRTIPSPSDATRALWKFVNYIFVNVVVAVIGFIVILRKKRSRDAYTARVEA